MPGFAREHLRPLLGSAALHLLLLGVLAVAALRWTTATPPVPLAIEGTVVRYQDLPPSLRSGKPARPKPAPAVASPPPAPARQDRADAAAERARQALVARRRVEAAAAREKLQQQQAAEAQAKRATAEQAQKDKLAKEQAVRDARLKAEREAELKRALAAEEAGAALRQSGVMDEYRALLVQAIERNWIRPPSARAGQECTLNVTQATGGTVVDVSVGDCNGDQAVRESITNAVYRSSPLPAPRDPRAFERRLVIVFKPTE